MVFSKKVLTIALIIVVVAALAYYVVIIGSNRADEDGAIDDSGLPEKTKSDLAILVKVAEARRDDLIIKLRSPGEAVTDRKIAMKAEVEGIVEKLNVRESQHVKKGEVLLELDDKRYRLDYENAEAARLKALSELILDQQFSDEAEEDVDIESKTVDLAKKQFDEARTLYQKGLISREEFEIRSQQYERLLIESGEKKDEVMAAMKGLTQAEINVKKAQIALEKTKVVAPFSGIITDIRVSEGESVTEGREIFTLVDISRIRVDARVLESEIGKMKVGREVDLHFSAYPGKVFRGKVSAISPVVNPEDKTCKVFVDVDNPEEEIKPGMHAEVEIAAEIHRNRLLVPQDAILTRSGRKLLFVVEGGLAKWRYIEVGLENEDFAEILDGVEAGDKVIIEGHFTLAHDAAVKVVD